MPYRLVESGERVILSVLIGADPSMIGLRVNHSKIISMKFGELDDIIQRTYGLREKNYFTKSVTDYYCVSTVAIETCFLSDFDLIVLETTCENIDDYFATHTILRALKLYNGADIFSCYSTNYRFQNGKICFGGLGSSTEYRHAIGVITPQYALTEEQKRDFQAWYSSVFLKMIQPNCSSGYQAMLGRYDLSYMIGISEAEYVMLFTTLETLFGTDLTKITSHIAKGTSALIGSSSKEKRAIRNKMYQLYDVRSRYVHDGMKVPKEALFELREIVRRVLVEICNRGYHTKDKNLNELRDMLLPAQSSEDTEKEE